LGTGGIGVLVSMGTGSVGGERGSGTVATTDGEVSMESWAIVGFAACSIGKTSTSVAIVLFGLMGKIGWEVAFADTVIVK